MKRLILIGLICLTALIPSSGQTWGVIGLSGTGAGGGGGDVSYIGSTKASGTGTSVTVNVPANATDGRIMILSAVSDTVDVPPVLPEGWTSITTTGTSSSEQIMGYRICSSEPESYDVTAASSAPLVVIVSLFSKTAGTWGIDDSEVATSGSDAVNTLQSGTVTMIASSMYVVAFANDGIVAITDINAGLTLADGASVSSAALYVYYESSSAGDKYSTSTWANTEQISVVNICLSAN